MKEITQTKTIEEVVGYEAADGTRFNSKEECKKYEESARVVIISRFNKLIIGKTSEYYLFESISCGNEEYIVALIKIKNADDLKAANMYSVLATNKTKFDESDIGKEIVVGIGYEYELTTCPACVVYGTIDEITNKINESMKKLLSKREED